MTKHVTRATIYDAPHFTPEQVAAQIASYPAHERDARAKGVPMLGSGRVFPMADEGLACEPFEVPTYFACIGGLDFGWEHPTAAVKLAWDRDNDTIYVCAAYRQAQAVPAIHAAAVKPWGRDLPWAWPHDGGNATAAAGGETLARQYRDHGLAMLPERATFPDGGNAVEAGVILLLEYMQAGRFKVFAHLAEWFAEFRLYHRRDGQIVRENDDLLSATRVAMMMLRFAKVPTPRRSANNPTSYATDYRITR